MVRGVQYNLNLSLSLSVVDFRDLELIDCVSRDKFHVTIQGLVKKYSWGGVGWGGAFGNVVAIKRMAHLLPSAQ